MTVDSQPILGINPIGFQRGGMMNNKTLAAFAATGLGSLMLIGSAGLANAADVTPSPSASPSTSVTHVKGDPAKKALHLANAAARVAIHDTFKASVQKAKDDFRAVLATHPTDAVRATAVEARKAAIDAAKSVQLTAMLAINPNWAPHAKGDQPEKSAKPSS